MCRCLSVLCPVSVLSHSVESCGTCIMPHPLWVTLYDKTNKKATSLLLFCLYSQSTLARRKRADDACPSGASPLGAGCGSTYRWAEALRYLGAGAGEVGGKYLKVNFFKNVYFPKIQNMYIFHRYVKFVDVSALDTLNDYSWQRHLAEKKVLSALYIKTISKYY